MRTSWQILAKIANTDKTQLVWRSWARRERRRLARGAGLLNLAASTLNGWFLEHVHHHANAPLHAARGRHEEAAVEFRKAIYSTTLGYTRTNYELAGSWIALERPREAVAILRPALRGTLDASNLYVTYTDLHERLGDAYLAAGEPYSAAAYYRLVLAAWRNADPEFRGRREAVRARLAALAQQPTGRLAELIPARDERRACPRLASTYASCRAAGAWLGALRPCAAWSKLRRSRRGWRSCTRCRMPTR